MKKVYGLVVLFITGLIVGSNAQDYVSQGFIQPVQSHEHYEQEINHIRQAVQNTREIVEQLVADDNLSDSFKGSLLSFSGFINNIHYYILPYNPNVHTVYNRNLTLIIQHAGSFFQKISQLEESSPSDEKFHELIRYLAFFFSKRGSLGPDFHDLFKEFFLQPINHLLPDVYIYALNKGDTFNDAPMVFGYNIFLGGIIPTYFSSNEELFILGDEQRDIVT